MHFRLLVSVVCTQNPYCFVCSDAKIYLGVLFLKVNTLKLALEGVEKERDYYFSKLREVELLCQEQGEENAQFVDRLMEVLYASDEQVSV